MTTYAGGTLVKSGYYIDAKSYSFANVEKDGGKLPGTSESRWLRVPMLVVMAAAPALGGLFVVALPFIGFGMTAYAIVRALGRHAKEGAKEIAATVAAPGLAPGEAHLTGRAADEGAEGKAAPDAKADALASEIEAKRNPKS